MPNRPNPLRVITGTGHPRARASQIRRTAPLTPKGHARGRPTRYLLRRATLLGFFIVTLDVVVVNVALPAIRTTSAYRRSAVGGGRLHVDARRAAAVPPGDCPTESAGAARSGARAGVFIAASVACGLAPTLGVLVVARLVQGAAAAATMGNNQVCIVRPIQEGSQPPYITTRRGQVLVRSGSSPKTSP